MKYLRTYESYYKKDPNRMDKLIHIVDSLQDVFDEYDIKELKGSYQDAAKGEIFYFFDTDFTQDTTIAVGIPMNISGGYPDHYISKLDKEIREACVIAEKRMGYTIGISSQKQFGYYIIFIYPLWENQ